MPRVAEIRPSLYPSSFLAFSGKVPGSIVSMDFTMDGGFVMVNSTAMEMVVANAETCTKTSPKELKLLRY